MEDTSKTRMNLAAINKVDPYAKDIVDTSSHVAFYIFNSDQNEWEKTDVEGAFFIYSRNAQPFHSIFINNRLNTTSFVEPITSHLELQAQAPFLLYRNERSRIRGFWFYNSLECDRISKLVSELVQRAGSTAETVITADNSTQLSEAKENNNVNIFKMLSNAQQEFNNSNQQHQNNKNSNTPNNANSGQVAQHTPTQNIASGNVLKFFESAKPTAEVSNYTQRILPNTLSVEQLEKQQRDIAPNTLHSLSSGGGTTVDESTNSLYNNQADNVSNRLSCSLLESSTLESSNSMFNKPVPRPGSGSSDMKPIVSRGPDYGFAKALTAATCTSSNLPGEQISLSKIFSNLNLQQSLPQSSSVISISGEVVNKPALMPPTMFDKPASASSMEPLKISSVTPKLEPLNKFQFVQAFNYLIQNDEDFVQKLHEAYLKTVSKFGTYQ